MLTQNEKQKITEKIANELELRIEAAFLTVAIYDLLKQKEKLKWYQILERSHLNNLLRAYIKSTNYIVELANGNRSNSIK